MSFPTIGLNAKTGFKLETVYDGFYPVILSNEIGFRKPQKQIFELASEKIGILPENLVFIDDSSRWVKSARAADGKLRSIMANSHISYFVGFVLHTPALCATPLHRGDSRQLVLRSPLERGARRAGCGFSAYLDMKYSS